MSKRKISSYFQRETDKIIDEAEEKTEIEFQEEENDARLPNSKPRNFQTKWLNEHKWLRYENNTMFCHFCRLANKKNPFGGEKGCTNFKSTALSRHVNSREHQDAMTEARLRETFTEAREKAVGEQAQGIITAMKGVYWLAKEEVATHKYSSLLDLFEDVGVESVKKMKVGENATYRSHHTAEGMQQSIYTVLQKEVDTLVQGSPFVSLLIDESTDISTTENLIIYIKLLNNFNPETHLLGNVHIPNGQAATVTQMVKDILASRHVDEKKVVGFGSDGASVMTGKNNGVAARLKRVNPFLISIHCMAHKLALCTSQASTGIQFLSTFKETLTALYRYFKKSSLRTHQLKEFQEIFQQPQLKVKEVYEIRWFAFYGALEALHRTWSSLLAYFESHDDPKAKAAGFEKALKKYEFVATMGLMMDVMPILTYLSLVFQKQHLDLSVIQPAVSSAVSQITAMKTSDGKYLKEITSQLPPETVVGTRSCEVTFQGRSIKVTGQQVKHFASIKTKFLENTLSNLELRFPSDASDIVNCLAILGMRGIRFVPDIAAHGNEQLEKLIEFYGKEKDGENVVHEPIIDGEKTRQEWSYLKELLVRQHYPTDSMTKLWELLGTHHKEEIPNLLQLASIALILPTSTAECERGFSAQNRIKTALRNRLTTSRLNVLMTIDIEGPTLRKFDFNMAYKEWSNEKRRVKT